MLQVRWRIYIFAFGVNCPFKPLKLYVGTYSIDYRKKECIGIWWRINCKWKKTTHGHWSDSKQRKYKFCRQCFITLLWTNQHWMSVSPVADTCIIHSPVSLPSFTRDSSALLAVEVALKMLPVSSRSRWSHSHVHRAYNHPLKHCHTAQTSDRHYEVGFWSLSVTFLLYFFPKTT